MILSTPTLSLYSLGADGYKQDKALTLLASHPVMSVQVLSETANIMRRKLGFEIAAIRAVISRISEDAAYCNPLP